MGFCHEVATPAAAPAHGGCGWNTQRRSASAAAERGGGGRAGCGDGASGGGGASTRSGCGVLLVPTHPACAQVVGAQPPHCVLLQGTRFLLSVTLSVGRACVGHLPPCPGPQDDRPLFATTPLGAVATGCECCHTLTPTSSTRRSPPQHPPTPSPTPPPSPTRTAPPPARHPPPPLLQWRPAWQSSPTCVSAMNDLVKERKHRAVALPSTTT
eukprot:TRINITY_DN22_c0_g1_i1.p2 TRINITY_DN22_c0_g1~~TRINITY_DN22_c0_g1_i1.p2  ORF type:complete len:212 (-),score=3.95 TRINITY_DN22_c0_g1_i1:357-992(-)